MQSGVTALQQRLQLLDLRLQIPQPSEGLLVFVSLLHMQWSSVAMVVDTHASRCRRANSIRYFTTETGMDIALHRITYLLDVLFV